MTKNRVFAVTKLILLTLMVFATIQILPVTAQTPEAGTAAAGGPTCGTQPVKLNAYFETGFDIPFKLADEFTKQFPNVTKVGSRMRSGGLSPESRRGVALMRFVN